MTRGQDMIAKLAKLFVGSVAAIIWTASGAVAQDAAELAKKLSNPVAAMISVPFQYNYDQNLGLTDDGLRSWFPSSTEPMLQLDLC